MRFFFYGTLLAGSGNPVADWLHAWLEPGCPGHATGRLYAVRDPLGWYPAFVPDPAGGKVLGMVHRTAPGFDAARLAVLDAYEDYDPALPERSEFVRRPVAVQLFEAGPAVEAQTYVWSKPDVAKHWPIASGDFRGFLRETGEAAYAAEFRDEPPDRPI